MDFRYLFLIERECELRLSLVMSFERVPDINGTEKKNKNKPDRATMRPECVSACIDHVPYMERQMDEQMDQTTE